MAEFYRVYQLRHGETTQNAANRTRRTDDCEAQPPKLFYGGGADSTSEGDVELTPTGTRQPQAAAMALQAAGVTIEHAISSTAYRARESLRLCTDALPTPPTMHEPLEALKEVSHGSLELEIPRHTAEEARLLRVTCHRAICRALTSRNVRPRLIESHGGWLTPLGRGDGTSYFLNACQIGAAVDVLGPEPNTLIGGHHGSGRQLRALTTSLTRKQREELYQKVVPLTDAQREAAEYITALRTRVGRELDEDELTAAFAPISKAAMPLLPTLRRLPAIGIVLDKACKLQNGDIVESLVYGDGEWVRSRKIKATLPPEGVPLSLETVKAEVIPFANPDYWV